MVFLAFYDGGGLCVVAQAYGSHLHLYTATRISLVYRRVTFENHLSRCAEYGDHGNI